MIKSLFFAFILSSLFISSPVLNRLGYGHGLASSPFYFKILPATYIALITIGVLIIDRKFYSTITKAKGVIGMVFSLAIIILYLFFRGEANSISFLADTFISVAFFSMIIPLKNHKIKIQVRNILLVFFLTNSLMAIAEKGLGFNFLEPVEGVGAGGFRATALHGHPLNNALITVIILSFIFLSSVRYKMLLLFVGLLGLVSFGTRGALYAFGALSLLYLVCINFFHIQTSIASVKKGGNISYLFSMLLLAGAGYYFIVSTIYGERLRQASYLDISSQARVDILPIIEKFSPSQLIFGLSQANIDRELYQMDIPIIENFWIFWILRFGLLFAIMFSFFFIKFLFRQVKQYKPIEQFYLISIFLFTASTNNSLATSTIAVSVFALCSFAFSNSFLVKKKKHSLSKFLKISEIFPQKSHSC